MRTDEMHPVVEQSATTVIKPIGADKYPAWNEYLSRQTPAGLFFRAEWDKAFATYRLSVDRLAAIRDGQIVGVLPLVYQRSLIFGKHIVSLPWFDACGVIADDDQIQKGLLVEAVRLAKRRGVSEIQLRHNQPLELSPHVRTDKVLMELALPDSAAELWDGFSAKVRNQVRKGQKAGLTVRSGGAELLDEFFKIYAENMRDLGSPAHHRRFFATVLREFEAESAVHITTLKDETVGAGLTMANGKSLEIPWASSLRKHNKLCVNHVMYSYMLQQACDHGFTTFRFGRSTPDSGTYKFKKQWGAQPQQLYWYLIPADAQITPDTAPPKDSYGRAAQIWQKLPVWLANLIGPKIIAKVA